ncbi:MAG: hypothetical protein F4Y00_00700 [Bacteroidetes bacterium SB0662_bin_6]|nr:hypothetical protein [Bacteroidetes bacterium SB0668_bin_1]MYE03485.1 hypothetical protein [Bacteroidetes bacterium SB0662_bin_6]
MTAPTNSRETDEKQPGVTRTSPGHTVFLIPDVEQIVKNADGHWKPAHTKLLIATRKLCENRVNDALQTIRSELSKPLNGWQFKRTKSPAQLTVEARNELKSLQLRHVKHEQEEVKLPGVNEVDLPKWEKWLGMIALLALFIVLEAAANMTLLSSALSTGLVGAFITALLVSAINVGALGAGSGLLVSALNRHSKTKTPVYIACGAAFVIVLALNLIVGRHREGFTRLIEARDQAGQSVGDVTIASARELAASVSLNPAAWELESFLFFALGLALCAVGFYKGYTFVRAGVKREKAKAILDKELADIKTQYLTLPDRYRDKLHDLRSEVAGWVEGLDQKRLQAEDVFEDIKKRWENGGHLGFVEAEFVIAYNFHNTEEIDHDMLNSHRDGISVDLSFPAGGADLRVLEEAQSIVSSWRESQRDEFFDQVHEELLNIEGTWKNYQSVVLGRVEAA